MSNNQSTSSRNSNSIPSNVNNNANGTYFKASLVELQVKFDSLIDKFDKSFEELFKSFKQCQLINDSNS